MEYFQFKVPCPFSEKVTHFQLREGPIWGNLMVYLLRFALDDSLIYSIGGHTWWSWLCAQ